MKKLLTMAAVATIAVASQGANITWGARNIYIPVASDVTADQTGIAPTTGSKFAEGALTVALFWVDNSSEKHSIGSFATTGEGQITAQVLGNSSTDKTLYDAMLAEGSSYKPSYYFTATYTTGDGTYTYEGSAVAGSSISNLPSGNIGVTANFATSGVGSWSYTAAPEPTSGMLLLLGVAGLALKRKRA